MTPDDAVTQAEVDASIDLALQAIGVVLGRLVQDHLAALSLIRRAEKELPEFAAAMAPELAEMQTRAVETERLLRASLPMLEHIHTLAPKTNA